MANSEYSSLFLITITVVDGFHREAAFLQDLLEGNSFGVLLEPLTGCGDRPAVFVGQWFLSGMPAVINHKFEESYIIGPMRQGTNSLWPRRSAQVFCPDATCSIKSKISRPTCGTVISPSAIAPPLTSMLSRMRL